MPKICKGTTIDGKPCKAPAIVKKFNPKSGKKYNINYCQMHQPGKISKKKCNCPHCIFHRKN